MGKWTKDCEKCKKAVEFQQKECDQSGLAWHMGCFVCNVCEAPLNERSVNIRGENNNQLFCSMHKSEVPGNQKTWSPVNSEMDGQFISGLDRLTSIYLIVTYTLFIFTATL